MIHSILTGLILISTVSLAKSDTCYHCLYAEGQGDNETLVTMKRNELHQMGVSPEEAERELQHAMKAYEHMGFDMKLAFRASCEDPRSMPRDSNWPVGDLDTCESQGSCGKIFSTANSLTTIWRGCPRSCQVGSQDSIDIACCQGDFCNQATVATVTKLLLLFSLLGSAVFVINSY